MKRILFGCLCLCTALFADEKPGVVDEVKSTKEVEPPKKVSTVKSGPESKVSLIPPRKAVPEKKILSNNPDQSILPLTNTITVAGILIFAIAFAIWLKYKKRGGLVFSQRQPLKLHSTLDVPGAKINLIEVGESLYLIGTSEGAISCLDKISQGEQKNLILSEMTPVRKATGGQGASFQDEYANMINQMSSKSAPIDSYEVQTENLVSELDQLKNKLKEMA